MESDRWLHRWNTDAPASSELERLYAATELGDFAVAYPQNTTATPCAERFNSRV
jgi:hypothetical protein